MSKVPLGVRVADELVEWTKTYAGERGVSQGVIVQAALEAFREDCGRGVPDLPSGRAARVPARVRSASDRAAAAGDSRPPAAAPALPAELVRRTGARMAREIVAPGSDVRRVRLDVVVARMGMVARSERLGPIAPVDLGRAKSKIKAGGVLVNEVVEKDPGRLIGEEMVALA